MDLIKSEVPCPVCGSEHKKPFLEPWENVTDPKALYGAASGIRGTQKIVGCIDCDMIYESPRYPEKVILEGYMSSEEGGHDSQYHMRVRSFYKALEKNKKYLPPKGAKVLDIGTAGGGFLDAATKFGYDAHGLEPSAYLVESGKKRGLQIEQGTIDNNNLVPESYDMITMWDVIEHVVDPKAALEEIHKLLKPDGVLLINYPDIGTWQAKLAGKRFWWILSVHLHHFTPKSIKDICQRAGFQTFRFKAYWQTLEFGYLESVAAHLGVPLAKFIYNLTPGFIRRIPLPYYASQTTALARKVKNV
ncbi:MAG: hypothetical protein CL675_11285 [Bdellovibrionaceae bacterium]|nr:hypothetical protein [Pseudobdellovibrionaceae bacterium]